MPNPNNSREEASELVKSIEAHIQEARQGVNELMRTYSVGDNLGFEEALKRLGMVSDYLETCRKDIKSRYPPTTSQENPPQTTG